MGGRGSDGGHRDVVVVGASAGGVEALRALVRDLPADLAATVAVVLHLPAEASSSLARILSRSGPLPAAEAVDGAPLAPGTIVVAPPDRHLMLGPDGVRVVLGPTENGHRPSLDPLFRSAGRWYGPRVVGVVLSGVLDDGVAGLQAVAMRGGRALVQDPDDALYGDMPRNALAAVRSATAVPLDDLGAALAKAVAEPVVHDPGPPSAQLEYETAVVGLEEAHVEDLEPAGVASPYTCPDCGGSMWEIEEGHDGADLLRFRCHVGHAWAPDGLLHAKQGRLEEALWAALRALEEQASLAGRLFERANARGAGAADRFGRRRAEALSQAAVVRSALGRLPVTVATSSGASD